MRISHTSISFLLAAKTASRDCSSLTRIASNAILRSDTSTSWEASNARLAAMAILSADELDDGSLILLMLFGIGVGRYGCC